MKSFVFFLLVLFCLAQLIGCQGSENDPSATKSAKAVAAADETKGKEALLSYLKALQNSDKKAAYASSNLTPELVEESRKKVINQQVNKLTKEQLAEAETVLRTSSSIDLYLKKLKPLLLKSATFEVLKTSKWSPKAPNVLLHEVKITYANKKDALSDKTGGRVKEFVLRFNQIQYDVNGHQFQEFLIEDKDFENMLERKLDVKAYF